MVRVRVAETRASVVTLVKAGVQTLVQTCVQTRVQTRVQTPKMKKLIVKYERRNIARYVAHLLWTLMVKGSFQFNRLN